METELLVGGGFAVATSGFLIKFLVDLVRDFKRTVDNHIDHNTAALHSQTEALNRMGDRISDLTEVMKERYSTH